MDNFITPARKAVGSLDSFSIRKARQVLSVLFTVDVRQKRESQQELHPQGHEIDAMRA